jgi:hypothetical protein
MEITKVKDSLRNCIGNRPCKDCPYEKGFMNFPTCAVSLMKEALQAIEELENKQ